MFVTSSGTTTEFETYEFDVFTRDLVIAGYVTGDKSINISEVSVPQIKTITSTTYGFRGHTALRIVHVSKIEQTGCITKLVHSRVLAREGNKHQPKQRHDPHIQENVVRPPSWFGDSSFFLSG